MARNNTDRSTPWLKRVLIPFWVIQLALMIFIFAIFVWVVADNVRDFAVYGNPDPPLQVSNMNGQLTSLVFSQFRSLAPHPLCRLDHS